MESWIMIELAPKIRKKIMDFFKKQLGYGYRCSNCDRNARIIEVSADEFAFDYVKFCCPGCHKRWILELHQNEIKDLVL